MATPYCIVCITVPAGKKAKDIAGALVGAGLAACVNIVPAVESIYRWKGKVERAREALLLVKIRKAAFARVASFVRSIHPYEVPEVIALAIDRGSRPTLAWLAQETRKS